MEHRDNLIAVRWTVAAVAPSTVSPHPNFGISHAVSGPELLALLAECRFADFARYREQLTDTAELWESGLLDAVQRSLDTSDQSAGVEDLLALVVSATLPSGARMAAALFASLALSELDRSKDAVEMLSVLAAEISELPESASAVLMAAMLKQQLAVRVLETGEREASRQLASDVVETLGVELNTFESFSTSEGIGWDSAQVQRDLWVATRMYAREMLSRLAPIEDNSWGDLIRSRPRWLDVRAERRISSGTDAFLRLQFRDKLSATISSQTFFMSDPVEVPVYSGLIAAELAGDINEIVHRREMLGRVRALSAIDASSPELMQESLRLLRHSNRHKTLRELINWVLARGPLVSLQAEARRVLDRFDPSVGLSRSSVFLLGDASEFMTATERSQAVDAVLAYRDQSSEPALSTTTMANWSRNDEIYRVLGKLVRGSGTDQIVADAVLHHVVSENFAPDAALRSLLLLVRELDWETISAGTSEQWLEWAGSPGSDGAVEVAASIFDAIRGPSQTRETVQRPSGIRLAVRLLVEDAAGLVPAQSEIAIAVAACIGELSRIQEEARQGSRTVGEYSAAEIAVALIDKFDATEVWVPLVDLLVDPAVDMASKRPAFDGLAKRRSVVPDQLLERLRQSWPEMSRGTGRVSFFDEPPLPIEPSALRFAAVFKLTDSEVLFEQVMELAGGSSDEGRGEAANSLPSFISDGHGVDWPLALAMQLSHDENPTVQGHAAAALVHLVNEQAYGMGLAVKRLGELLALNGLRVPKFALEAIFGLLARNAATPALQSLAPMLNALAAGHIARNVREAAAKIVVQLPDPG